MENLNSLWSIIGIILAAALAWSFTSLSAWQQSRKQDNNTRREVAFYLLEFHFLITKINVSLGQASSEITKMIEKITQRQIAPELEALLVQKTISMVEPLLINAYARRIEKLKDGFNSTVKKLSGIEPVLAYRLSGQEEAVLILTRVEDFWKDAEKGIRAENIMEWNQSKTPAKELITSLGAEEVQKQIELLIREVSKRLPKRNRLSILSQVQKISEDKPKDSGLENSKAVFDIIQSMIKLAPISNL